MENAKKYCPNCGKEQTKESIFCIDCGYDFNEKVFPESSIKNESKSKFNLQDYKQVLKDKRVLGGLLVITVLVIAYFTVGGIDIAGTYEADDTMVDNSRSNTLSISRSGDATLRFIDDYDQLDISATVRLVESNDGYRYYADLSENVKLEVTMPITELYDGYYWYDLEEIIELAGLQQKQNGNMVTISGEVPAFLAKQMDIDLSEMEIIREDNYGALILFDTFYYDVD
ncbi:hypothetical protein ACO1PF_10245 [Alkalibacterium sp. f15]|uniref:hypothetical protein n=1 Tax=Alkalibacterium sp. f15 TaxID=3414029 RepID=UPI003BF8FD3A